jgi:glyoxylase I family protein
MSTDSLGMSLDHVTITVKDLKRTIDFYSGLLGFKVLGQRLLEKRTFKIVWLQTGEGRMLEVFEFQPSTGKDQDATIPQSVSQQDIGLRHIGFTIPPKSFDAMVERLRAAKIAFTIEPTVAEWCQLRLVFFKDPDGNIVEIISGKLENLEPLTYAH